MSSRKFSLRGYFDDEFLDRIGCEYARWRNKKNYFCLYVGSTSTGKMKMYRKVRNFYHSLDDLSGSDHLLDYVMRHTQEEIDLLDISIALGGVL